MLFSFFGLKTKLNGQDQDRLGQDQDLKKMVLRASSLTNSALGWHIRRGQYNEETY